MPRIFTALALTISSCLGLGYLPVAPGTAGSALALPLAWLLYRTAGPWGVVGGALVASTIGTWASARAELHHKQHDSSRIVIDELAGQLVACIAVPCTWPNLVVAFGWFRLCDTVKPWPAGWADRRVPGGFGVMLDDLFAGVQAGALTAILVYSGAVTWAVGVLSS